MNEILEMAKKEIKDSLSRTREKILGNDKNGIANNNQNEISDKKYIPNEDIARVTNRANDALRTLQESFSSRSGKKSKDTHNEEILQILAQNGYNICKQDTSGQTTQLFKIPVNPQINHLEYITYGLDTTPNTLTLLPYLMACYYLNMHDLSANKPPSVPTPIFALESESTDNLKRNKDDFTSYYFGEENLPQYFELKKSNKSMDIQKINNWNTYRKYISTRHKILGIENTMCYKLTPLQYKCLFQALVYSICVLACAHTDSIAEQIDYQLSFELFDKHTAAFHTLYVIDEEYEDEDNKTCVLPLLAFLQVKEALDDTKKILQTKDDFTMSQLYSCGIQDSDFMEWSDYPSPKWYIQSAAITVATLHPLTFPLWIDFF